MPEYLLRDKNTGEERLEWMGISECELYLQNNPHIERLVHGAPKIGYSTVTTKPDGGFKDVLKEIKKKHRGSTINTW